MATRPVLTSLGCASLRAACGGLRVLLVVALLAGGCARYRTGLPAPLRPSEEVQLDQERELGLAFDRELQKHVHVIRDPVVTSFIYELGQSIVAQIEPQPFLYRFRIIVDPSLNAFAVPGGYVYFHTGTVLAAGSPAELAGVMGHEVAHVKARHFARMQQKAQLPDLLLGVAGMAGAVATGEPGIFIATQAVNVAAQLKFTREFENEADERGAIFVSRAGYDADGIARFFERLLAERERQPSRIPPYLFSHPQVEDRIEAAHRKATTLRPMREPPVGLPERLIEVQGRLGRIIETRRDPLPAPTQEPDRAATDPLLEQARTLAAGGERDRALLALAQAEAREPRDPRVPFEIGELLRRGGQPERAAEAYRRTLRIDPSRAQVHYQLGLAYRDAGAHELAVQAFEQALLRTTADTPLHQRVSWEIEKLIFPVLQETGFASGEAPGPADPPLGAVRDGYPAGAPRLAWWAKLHRRFAERAARLQVRWTDPEGRVVQEAPAERLRGPYVGSRLEAGPEGARAGTWQVEARLEDDVLAHDAVHVGPPAGGAAAPFSDR